MRAPAILILDDDRVLVDLLTDILGGNYSIAPAFNGEEAWEVLKSTPIDLIIIDIILPDIDGFQLCSMIKENKAFGHIPIIILSAKSGLEDKVSGLQKGVDVYIEKPFSPAYLDAQVFSILQNRLKLKERFERNTDSGGESVTTLTDQQFLASLHLLIETHIGNALLSIEFLAEQLHMSRSSLYRKIRATSNYSPYEIIEQVRLKRAAALMHEGRYKINEISVLTGFSSPSQFTRSFKRKFGKAPLSYLREYVKRRNMGSL
ncbi:response regulator [Niabella sp.]|uniref:response regulator transcription factor n=1 Tax=Niabella sp. TaxID=1962976 RepID=UPI0026328F8C|nr:response regulator [Niabella sp.]